MPNERECLQLGILKYWYQLSMHAIFWYLNTVTQWIIIALFPGNGIMLNICGFI